MKSCLIPNDHMFGLRILRREVRQKQVTHFQADARQAKKFSSILSVHFQGTVKIAPFIFGLIGRRRPQPAQAPTPPHHRNQAIAVLIGHPDAHRLSTSHAQVLELRAQRLLELGGLGRVFFRRESCAAPSRLRPIFPASNILLSG